MKKLYIQRQINAPTQADKRDSFAPIYRAAVHMYIGKNSFDERTRPNQELDGQIE